MKKIAIVQSNYIPWKGYFDLIAAVDEFILFDDMQFTRRDWRNRNLIKTPQGLQWLTVPVQVKGKYTQAIRETAIQGSDWAGVHWKTLTASYTRAPHFREIAAILEPLYRERYETISALNRRFIEAICGYLGIGTKLTNSWDYSLIEGKSERLADLCRQAGATTYVSGPAARNYLDENAFLALGIAVDWFNYDGYPTYPQLWGEFNHGVSIVDLLFNCGADAPHAMKDVLRRDQIETSRP
jgi:WbqC-like protein family